MKQEYISISEFAERAGVSKAYIYKALKDRLQPYLKEVDSQKRLNINYQITYTVIIVIERKTSSSFFSFDIHTQLFF